jgi:di/tricarboxylate transporter
MRGQGAIVFLAVFIIFLMATLAVSSLPPGRAFYGLLGVPETDYPVLGVPATVLVVAVFNGVFYGVIAWLIFTFGKKFVKPT